MLIMMILSADVPLLLLMRCFPSTAGISSKALFPEKTPNWSPRDLIMVFCLVLTFLSQIALREGHHHNRQGAIVDGEMSFLFVLWMHCSFFIVDFPS